MKEFIVIFKRNIEVDGKKAFETRRVVGVKAKTENSAKNKAFRKICFFTRFDHWKFYKIEEEANA